VDKTEKQAQTANWRRSIFVTDSIDEAYVRQLAPTILDLRQQSDEPITVGIDSPGGSLASLDTLLGLLTGPTQGQAKGRIVTVATNRAFSAAASFLAFGDYSVALRHSRILYHDVRYGGMEDITPEKARLAAKSLQDANDAFALRLANQIIRRLVWIYLDLKSRFSVVQNEYPKTFKKFSATIDLFSPPIQGQHAVDIASFATCLFAQLSRENDGLIRNVMDRLDRWVRITNLAKNVPSYRQKRSRRPGLLDGARHLHGSLGGESKAFSASDEDLKLLLTLLVAKRADKRGSEATFFQTIDESIRDFGLIKSMNDRRHTRPYTTLLLQHDTVFFGRPIRKELEGKNDEEQMAILAKAAPQAQLFWLFCVSLCRELFEGEHDLTPNDAQLLGLVNEVAGGGPIESQREFALRLEREDSGKDQPPSAD